MVEYLSAYVYAGKGWNMDGWFVGNFPLSTDVVRMSEPAINQIYATKLGYMMKWAGWSPWLNIIYVSLTLWMFTKLLSNISYSTSSPMELVTMYVFI